MAGEVELRGDKSQADEQEHPTLRNKILSLKKLKRFDSLDLETRAIPGHNTGHHGSKVFLIFPFPSCKIPKKKKKKNVVVLSFVFCFCFFF